VDAVPGGARMRYVVPAEVRGEVWHAVHGRASGDGVLAVRREAWVRGWHVVLAQTWFEVWNVAPGRARNGVLFSLAGRAGNAVSDALSRHVMAHDAMAQDAMAASRHVMAHDAMAQDAMAASRHVMVRDAVLRDAMAQDAMAASRDAVLREAMARDAMAASRHVMAQDVMAVLRDAMACVLIWVCRKGTVVQELLADAMWSWEPDRLRPGVCQVSSARRIRPVQGAEASRHGGVSAPTRDAFHARGGILRERENNCGKRSDRASLQFLLCRTKTLAP
jgi:pentapeptide MXKDX repeat protein